MEKPSIGKQVSGKIPKKNSREWISNESKIAKDPTLRRIRDIQQGFRPTGVTTGINDQAYKDGWERIFGNKDEK
tara:strand:+ start:4333 stop:4554 length:222 start_codon:yes stop_codon:yes gene_type:complete